MCNCMFDNNWHLVQACAAHEAWKDAEVAAVKTRLGTGTSAVETALKETYDAELFEDGVSAGLHERGIESKAEAYRLGRLDAVQEVCDRLDLPLTLHVRNGCYAVALHADGTHTDMNAQSVPVANSAPTKLWLWRNHVDGRPEYWAFDNPFPIHLDNGDPQTLGEPCGYALVKPSRNGRPMVSEEAVLRRIARAAETSLSGRSEPWKHSGPTPRTTKALMDGLQFIEWPEKYHAMTEHARKLEREVADLMEASAPPKNPGLPACDLCGQPVNPKATTTRHCLDGRTFHAEGECPNPPLVAGDSPT